MFHLFDQQFHEARTIFNALGKNFKSKKALDLKEKLIFLNIFFHLIGKVHFNKEESLKFKPFYPFNNLCKALKRIQHYKLSVSAYAEEKARTNKNYLSYDKFLAALKEDLYKEVYEVIISTPTGIWEPLYSTAFYYSRDMTPLMIDTSTTKLINEEIKFVGLKEWIHLDSQSINEIIDGLRVLTLVENIRIAVGLNPVFTEFIHGEMRKLNLVLNNWYKNHLLAQHLNFFFSEKEQVSDKYLLLAKNIKSVKLDLTEEVNNLSINLFSKVAV